MENGEKALEHLENRAEDKPYDLIFVDQFMEASGGVLLGTQVVEEMRRRGIGAVIVGCSGNGRLGFGGCGMTRKRKVGKFRCFFFFPPTVRRSCSRPLLDMEKEFMDAGCSIVWSKPMPSETEAISQIRKEISAMRSKGGTR